MTLECLMAYTVTDDHSRQLKVFKSLQGWQKDDPAAIRAALTEKMIEAGSKLARFVGLDAYATAGGSSRANLFGDEVYLESPDLLHRLAEEKLDGIRKELEAEGWGWVEINPERDWDAVHRCGRIQPRLVNPPAELLDLKSQLDAELEAVDRALEDTESDALLDEQESIRDRLDEVEGKLAAHVGFDTGHKALAGCYVSIGQDGTAFLDKGLVKPEHRKVLAKLLRADDSEGEMAKAKPKHGLPESLRRDLAASRLEIARVEIAQHPALAFDLLVFQAASALLDKRPCSDGPDVEFHLPKPGKPEEPNAATQAFAAIEQSLPVSWRKPKSEETRFQAFRGLPDEDKLELLAYCVALTLQPKFATDEGEEATAYDAALGLTGASVATYWRPTRDNFLSRVTRDRLLAISRETLGELWAQSSSNEKKSLLVAQLDRAFANPGEHGNDPEQVAKLKSWLPVGMAFETAPTPKPAKSRKARKAA
jgi:ParB family chromosome partitioning protein